MAHEKGRALPNARPLEIPSYFIPGRGIVLPPMSVGRVEGGVKVGGKGGCDNGLASEVIGGNGVFATAAPTVVTGREGIGGMRMPSDDPACERGVSSVRL